MQLASVYPTIPGDSFRMSTPDREATCGDAYDAALSSGPGFEVGVPQHAANVSGDFKRPNIEVCQAIVVAAKCFLEDVPIAAEERRASQRA